MNAITEGLLDQNHYVRVFCINTQKHPLLPEKINKDYLKKTKFESVYINTAINIPDAFINLFNSESYNIQRFYSKEFEKRLIEILKSESFDVVQLESLYVTSYLEAIRRHTSAKVILRAHNVEYEIWSGLAEHTSHPLKGLYLNFLSRRLKNYECDMINKVDGVAAITSIDAAQFSKIAPGVPIIDIPLSIKTRDTDELNNAIPDSIFYLGAFDWLPNREGVNWFLNTAWPHVSENHPDLKFFIAGRKMSSSMKKINVNNVEIVGEVGNAEEFMLSKSIMIVPLLSGSGVRVKIIEAMNLGKTIISTSMGASGINYTNEKNILIADNPLNFAKAITRCINDVDFSVQLGNNARELVKNYYSREKVTDKLIQFYTGI